MENLMNIISLLGGIMLALFYIPNIIQLYKCKDATSFSLVGWLLLVLGVTALFVNAFYVHATVGAASLLFTQGVNFVFSVIYFIQICYYKIKTNKK